MPDVPKGIQLRLAGGAAWNGKYASGRVEVFKDGEWGTVSRNSQTGSALPATTCT